MSANTIEMSSLKELREIFNEQWPEIFEEIINIKQDAMEEKEHKVFKQIIYDAMNGGKKIRAAFVLGIVEKKTGSINKSAFQAGLCVELLHAASLILDDMPFMDNDETRRDKPSIWKKYGQSEATLMSMAMVSMSIGLVADITEKERPEFKFDILREVLNNLGHNGITLGQSMDLNYSQSQTANISKLEKIIKLKTGTLFFIPFYLAHMYTGGKQEDVEVIRDMSNELAMLYQLADDVEDIEQDSKTDQKNTNYVLLTSFEQAEERYNQAKDNIFHHLETLNLDDIQSMNDVFVYLDKKMFQINKET